MCCLLKYKYFCSSLARLDLQLFHPMLEEYQRYHPNALCLLKHKLMAILFYLQQLFALQERPKTYPSCPFLKSLAKAPNEVFPDKYKLHVCFAYSTDKYYNFFLAKANQLFY